LAGLQHGERIGQLGALLGALARAGVFLDGHELPVAAVTLVGEAPTLVFQASSAGLLLQGTHSRVSHNQLDGGSQLGLASTSGLAHVRPQCVDESPAAKARLAASLGPVNERAT